MLFQLDLETRQTNQIPPIPPQINGTDILSGTALEPSCHYVRHLIPGVAVHLCMSSLRSRQTIYNVAPAISDVVMKGVGVNRGYFTRCGVHTNEGPHPSCQRVRLFYKRPPDGPQWPSVTPEKKLGCYENDIPQHKASLFSWWAAKSSPPSLPKHNTPRYQIFKQTDTLAAYQSFVTPQALRIKVGARLTKPNVGFCLFACGELHRSLFAWLA